VLRDDMRYGGVGSVALSLLAQLVIVDAHALEAFVLQQSEWMQFACDRKPTLASSWNRSPRIYAQQ